VAARRGATTAVTAGPVLPEDPAELLAMAQGRIEQTLEALRATVEAQALMPRVGEQLSALREAHTPVVIIPGITSTAMELWRGRPCARQTFRDKFWGSLDMARSALRDQRCWMRHLELDLLTWDDPDGIRLRPARGFSSADYFVPGYAVWARPLENLHDVGFEPRSMSLLSYDWRMSPRDLERREAFFMEFRDTVHLLRARNEGRKVAIVTHSMGALVGFHFLQWVAHHDGVAWIERNVDSIAFIAGPFLGVPKAVSAVLSGEMRDTAEFGRFSRQMVGALFGRRGEVARFMRSLGSLPSMLVAGSDRVWNAFVANPPLRLLDFTEALSQQRDDYQSSSSNSGTSDSDPNDSENADNKTSSGSSMGDDSGCATNVLQSGSAENTSAAQCAPTADTEGAAEHGEHIEPGETVDAGTDPVLREPLLSREDVRELVEHKWYSPETYLGFLTQIAPRYMRLVREHYALDSHTTAADSRSWSSALLTPLPPAKSLKIYCMYGLLNASSTEYGYQYLVDHGTPNTSAVFFLNTSAQNAAAHVRNGVQLGPGDGSVPLPSMAYPCWLWQQGQRVGNALNPAGCEVRIREYLDGASKTPASVAAAAATQRAVGGRSDFATALRGGEYAASHIEILGHRDLLRDLIHITTRPVNESAQDLQGEKLDEHGMLPDSVHSGVTDVFAKVHAEAGAAAK